MMIMVVIDAGGGVFVGMGDPNGGGKDAGVIMGEIQWAQKLLQCLKVFD